MLQFNQNAIDKLASMKDIIDSIDAAYNLYYHGNFHMPTRNQVMDNQNTLVLMPCFIKEYVATKLITVFPDNKKKDLPIIHGTVLLNCNQTGETKAILDGSYITAVRTGAIGGNAVRHLARDNVSTLAIIGTGVQGFYQTLAACEERSFQQINVYNRTQGKKVTNFIQRLKSTLQHDINIIAKDSAQEAIEDADVVITATTSTEPVLPNDKQLLKDKLFIGIGSFQPNMHEFPEALYSSLSHIFIDSEDAKKESGDLITPLEQSWVQQDTIQTLASFIEKPTFDVETENNTILFKSTGMALFDAVVAARIYEASLSSPVY